MSYEVLARKWRPARFEEVVGQEHVTTTLKNAISSGRIAHAYLFVGPRGVGKTSIARILAKALNCADGPTVTPCGKCDSCKEIVDSRSLDVIEIDGASNNSVDQVRELRDTVRYMPARGPFKIYVIDEVHMLSTQAFNALLKTLEEPPSHVKFLFATTEPQKILATILSRCQRFDLRRIPVPMIIQRLTEIAKDEDVAVSDDALLAIARGSEGGLRDAESALDQLISFKGQAITEDDVLSVFGLVSRSALEDLADAILRGDMAAVIGLVGALDSAGKDMQRLVLDLLSHFRNLLVCSCARDSAIELDIAESQLDTLCRQAEMAAPERLIGISDILVETDGRLRYSLSKRTLLETALIRCARAASAVSIEEILQQLNKLKKSGTPIGRSASAERSIPAVSTAPEASSTPAAAEVSNSEEPVEAGDEVGMLKTRWHEIVERVSRVAPLARSALLDSCPVSVSDDTLVIGFDPEFAEHYEVMKSARNMKAFRLALRDVLKRDIEPELRILKKSEAVVLPADVPATPQQAHDDDSPVAEKKSARATAGAIKEWMQNDTVRKTLEAFDGEIVDVRE